MKSKEPKVEQAVDSGRDHPLLQVRELSVHLTGGVTAVDRVSFTLGARESLALVGESGCGKTLTALSLLRAVPPEVGRIEARGLEFEGRELTRLSPGELRRVRGSGIAMIFQDPSAALDPLFTVGDQLVETIRAHRRLGRRPARDLAERALSEAGLAESARVLASYPHQLSGGQRQRAMIAMALATGPRLLIADEPTTALDVTVQRQILELLAGLRRSRGLALLLITHNLSIVARLAGRVAVMYAGQIVEEAPVEQLFRAPAHPYTRALLACLPRVDRRVEEPGTIPGQVPRPGDWPAGCRFRPRCALAREGCERDQALRPLAAGRSARCWLAGVPPADSAAEER